MIINSINKLISIIYLSIKHFHQIGLAGSNLVAETIVTFTAQNNLQVKVIHCCLHRFEFEYHQLLPPKHYVSSN